MTKALMRGGREFFGWTEATYAMANLYDAVNVNTQVSGSWKNKPPKFPPYPMPRVRNMTFKSPDRKGATVADVFAAFHKRG